MLENIWADIAKKGVKVEITLDYSDDDLRPSDLIVLVTLKGEAIKFNIPNSAGAALEPTPLSRLNELAYGKKS